MAQFDLFLNTNYYYDVWKVPKGYLLSFCLNSQ